MVILQAISEVLAGHIVRRNRSIPCLEGVSRVLREVRSSGRSRSSIDRRQKNEITAGVIDATATEGQTETIAIEPETVVKHEAEEALLGAFLGIAVAADSAATLASSVSGESHGSFANDCIGAVIVLVLDAVVGV